jgi:hypothetical protein
MNRQLEIPSSRRAVVLAALLPFALSALPAAAEIWQARDIKTSIALRPGAAASLGLELRQLDQPVAFEHHPLSVSRGRDAAFASLFPLGLGAEIEKGHVFTRLAGGAVPHRGGFELAYPGGRLSLQGFVLASGKEPRTFEIRTAQGEPVFLGDLAHFKVDRQAGRLQVFNIELRMSPELAGRLGSPRLAGSTIGVLAIDARLVVPGTVFSGTAVPGKAGAAGAGTPPACGDWSGQQDVALINIPSVGQAERDEVGARVGITPSAFLKNVGTANVPWQVKFSGNQPPYNTAQHPFLVWSLYRLAGGRIEQLGISDVKHAFLTVNVNCDEGACNDGDILGLGCEDVYGENSNESPESLSFRDEITAHSGTWQSQGSHFDQNGDNVQDHPEFNPDPPFAHRMLVQEADLATAGAQYFIEAWYLVRDDIDIFNSMGYRRVVPSFDGGSWSFSLPNAFQQGSALNAWVDPDAPGAGNANVVFDTTVGKFRLAVRTTSLGGGQWRYDYALANHDFDRQIGRMSIPLFGSTAGAFYFRDHDQNAGNDWSTLVTPSSITWTKAAGKGLDWGETFNFGFVSNSPPAVADAGLDPVEGDGPGLFAVSTRVPAAGSLIFGDGFEMGSTGAWTQTVP